MAPYTANSILERTAILEAATALHMVGAGSGSPARLIALLCDERLGADELAGKIEAHPVLSARVLKIANSAYYGQSRGVGSVRQALLILGSNAVRGIAAAACIDQVMPRRTAALPDIGSLFRHSLATAIACEMLATSIHPPLVADAFIAGLIHNLGVVIQARVDATGMAAMINARRADPVIDIRALEEQHVQVRHEECAAVLFDAWQLPDGLIAAARHHHTPEAAPEPHRALVALVSTAATVALAGGFTYSLEPRAPAVAGPDIQHIVSELRGRVEQLSQALS